MPHPLILRKIATIVSFLSLWFLKTETTISRILQYKRGDRHLNYPALVLPDGNNFVMINYQYLFQNFRISDIGVGKSIRNLHLKGEYTNYKVRGSLISFDKDFNQTNANDEFLCILANVHSSIG